MSRYRYGPWRGGRDPLAPPYDLRSAVDDLGQDVLSGGSLAEAMRDLLRRGPQPGRGLDDLLDQVRQRRRDLRRSGDLAGVLDEVRELLDEAVTAERDELARDAGEDARLRETRLDLLPDDTARAVTELADYDWRSAEARQAYERIRELLREQVLDQRFRGMRDAMSGTDGQPDPAAMQRVKDMLADLNALLAAHARGEDTTDRFREFMARHGELFPEQPQDVDELVDALARRAAAAERLLRSLSPQQRDELARLMSDALSDVDLASELAQLDDNLRALRPGLDWRSRERVQGDEPLGYGQAAGVLEELSDLDALAEAMGQDYPGASLDDVDVEAVQRQLGERAAADVRALRDLERELTEQGWLRRGTDGLQLTPKALRRLGQTALRRVFAQLDARDAGAHDLHDAGRAGDPTGSSRSWQFGDEQPIDVVRTVTRAVQRSGPRRPVRLQVEDFEIVETERRASAAVALCVDLSYSMVSEGRWGPMKQTALALSHLVSTRFRQDALQVIGFHRWAARMSIEELAAVEPEWIQGTNLHNALLLAGQHLRRHAASDPVVLVVTDGEPTAHLDDGGHPAFAWPPVPETVRRTVGEVDALTRYGATVNAFVLGDDPGLRRFVDALVKRNGGRMFTPSTERLGEYVVADYLRLRRGRRRSA